jgi:hypothetical protein
MSRDRQTKCLVETEIVRSTFSNGTGPSYGGHPKDGLCLASRLAASAPVSIASHFFLVVSSWASSRAICWRILRNLRRCSAFSALLNN